MQTFVILSLFMFIAVFIGPRETFAGALPKVRILAMGGTIAGVRGIPDRNKGL